MYPIPQAMIPSFLLGPSTYLLYGEFSDALNLHGGHAAGGVYPNLFLNMAPGIHQTFQQDGVKSPAFPPQDEGELVDWLVRNEKQNKSYAYDTERPNAKKAILRYKLIAHSDNYYLLEIDLKTGRHHQIRCQLAKMGCPIKGDLKYGFDRSNKDGGISLHARSAEFIHPVSKENVRIVAPVPDDNLWKALSVDR